MKKHTTTPWKQTGSYFDADGRLVGRALQMKGNNLEADEKEEALSKANAAFIVRAVNSHEELLGALKMAADLCENHLIDFKKYGLTCDADILKRYKDVISKAEGK